MNPAFKARHFEALGTPALELDKVSMKYGDRVAVAGASLAVHNGEVMCLLGPSGCGKTTLLRIVAGLEKPQSGTVAMDGRKVSGAGVMRPPEERRIGMLFQDYALFPHMTIAANIAFGLKESRSSRVRELLAMICLSDRSDSYPGMLSGGEQQRVALARALAPNPRFLLLDEPFSGLDARLRDEIRDRTLHMLQEAGIAVLMVTPRP